jgi:hypothetical protein
VNCGIVWCSEFWGYLMVLAKCVGAYGGHVMCT